MYQGREKYYLLFVTILPSRRPEIQGCYYESICYYLCTSFIGITELHHSEHEIGLPFPVNLSATVPTLSVKIQLPEAGRMPPLKEKAIKQFGNAAWGAGVSFRDGRLSTKRSVQEMTIPQTWSAGLPRSGPRPGICPFPFRSKHADHYGQYPELRELLEAPV